MKSKKLSKQISSQVLELHKQLQTLNRFDELSLFNPSTVSVDNYDFYANLVEEKAKLYESLNFLIKKDRGEDSDEELEEGGYGVLKGADFFHNQGLQSAESRSQLHFNTLDKLYLKMEGIFHLVEEYLDQLDSDLYQVHFQRVLEANLGQLRAVLSSKEGKSKKVEQLEKEFQKISDILHEKLIAERKSLVNYLEDTEDKIKKEKAKMSDKGVLVTTAPSALPDSEDQSTLNIDMSFMKVQCQSSGSAGGLSTSTTSYVHICFSSKNSFLCTAYGYGIVVQKNGQQVYNKNPGNNMANGTQIFYCKNSYYIYNSSPQFIYRKKEDSSEPTIWWKKQSIANIWQYNKIIKPNHDKSALLVNVNNTDLLAIEIKSDGNAGRELVIKNTTGSRIYCHEPLSKNEVLTVNKNGLMVIYQANFTNYAESSEVNRLQIPLRSGKSENQFWLVVCEKSDLLAVMVDSSSKASRILICSLKGEKGSSMLSFVTELDISAKGFSYHGNGCFSPYIGDKLILCASAYGQQAKAYGYDRKKKQITELQIEAPTISKYCYGQFSRVGNQVWGVVARGALIKYKFGLFLE